MGYPPPPMFEMISLADPPMSMHGLHRLSPSYPRIGKVADAVSMYEQFKEWWDEEFERNTGFLPPFSQLVKQRCKHEGGETVLKEMGGGETVLCDNCGQVKNSFRGGFGQSFRVTPG